MNLYRACTDDGGGRGRGRSVAAFAWPKPIAHMLAAAHEASSPYHHAWIDESRAICDPVAWRETQAQAVAELAAMRVKMEAQYQRPVVEWDECWLSLGVHRLERLLPDLDRIIASGVADDASRVAMALWRRQWRMADPARRSRGTESKSHPGNFCSTWNDLEQRWLPDRWVP